MICWIFTSFFVTIHFPWKWDAAAKEFPIRNSIIILRRRRSRRKKSAPPLLLPHSVFIKILDMMMMICRYYCYDKVKFPYFSLPRYISRSALLFTFLIDNRQETNLEWNVYIYMEIDLMRDLACQNKLKRAQQLFCSKCSIHYNVQWQLNWMEWNWIDLRATRKYMMYFEQEVELVKWTHFLIINISPTNTYKYILQSGTKALEKDGNVLFFHLLLLLQLVILMRTTTTMIMMMEKLLPCKMPFL